MRLLSSLTGGPGRISLLALCLLALSGLARGHNLWITARGAEVRVVFEHAPNPGKGNYNAEILGNGETWVRTPGRKEPSPVTVRETGPTGARFLTGLTAVAGPRAIEHACLFGIYRGRLDHFYGKFLDVANAEQLESLARASKLALDIVPTVNCEALELKILWQGEPLKDFKFGVITPGGEEISLEANAAGIVTFEPSEPGLYGFWAIRSEFETKGEYRGEKYSGTMQGTTLSLFWPLGGTQ